MDKVLSMTRRTIGVHSMGVDRIYIVLATIIQIGNL